MSKVSKRRYVWVEVDPETQREFERAAKAKGLRVSPWLRMVGKEAAKEAR